jgi:hypothetical protein
VCYRRERFFAAFFAPRATDFFVVFARALAAFADFRAADLTRLAPARAVAPARLVTRAADFAARAALTRAPVVVARPFADACLMAELARLAAVRVATRVLEATRDAA